MRPAPHHPARLPLVAMMVLSASVAARQQPPRFSSGVEAVRVDVLVTDHGTPVTGLTASDFEVRDDGVPQDVALVGYEEIQLNVVLVLDLSASVQGERLEQLRRASRALVQRLAPEDRAAILGFSHAVLLGSTLTRDHASLLSILDSAKPAGDTALVDAVYSGLIVGEQEPGRVLVVVFSDGLDISSWLTPTRVVDVANRSEAVVYAVSTQTDRPPFLEQVTAQTGGRLLRVETRDLGSTFVRILNEFRERYLLTYTPRGVPRGGWHTLDVRVKGRRLTVKARRGYAASPGRR
jgi:VWFA-related protein